MSRAFRVACIASFGLALASGCTGGTGQRLNVVLIVLDTVRADRLACSGEGRAFTPNFAALCDRGIRFERASSTSSWTLPAHASLFTGLYPIEHGATQENTRLAADVTTLAEVLTSRGYRTFGVSANPMVSIKSGLARGFEEFVEAWRMPRESAATDARSHANYRAVSRLLAGLAPDERFFLFVNYIEAHGPYTPPEPYRSLVLGKHGRRARDYSPRNYDTLRYYLDPASISSEEFEMLSDLYDAEISHLDELVGGLIDGLEEMGHLSDTLVIVTSDHGENLGEHGHFRHVFNLYGTTVHVPLLMLLPGAERAGEVRRESVGLVDVFATILAAAGGAPRESPGHGRDLLFAGEVDRSSPIMAEYYYPLQALKLFENDSGETEPEVLQPYLRRLRSIEVDGLRLIWSSDGRVELFNLTDDPGEIRDLAGQAWVGERERRLRERLGEFVAKAGGPRPTPDDAKRSAELEGALDGVDPASAELLKELGYLPR